MRKVILSFVATFLLAFSSQFSFAALSLPASSAPSPETVKSAVAELKGLSKKEKKARYKNIKQAIKDYKAAKKAGQETDTNTLLLVILAILLPPLAVYLYEKEINNRFWISLLLTLLFWLPGVIYALVLILGGY